LSSIAATPELRPRRQPAQQRARDTIEHILDTAAVLLDDVGAVGFNTNLLADAAGIRVRTIYRYFPNKLAVIVALGERYAHWERAFAETVLAPEMARLGWRRGLERVVDRYVRDVMALPGFLALRRATKASPELRAVENRASEALAAVCADLLRAAGVRLGGARRRAISRALIEASSALLDLSYTADGRRRAALVAELKRMQLAYLATYLEP
jgi:AcrR family transcriptional regulator